MSEPVSSQARSLVWFREGSLRLHDHPALRAGLREGPALLLFVFNPEGGQDTGRVNHNRFLLQSLEDLRESVQRRGGQLLFARGEPTVVLPSVCARWRVGEVFVQDSVLPHWRAVDAALGARLGVPLRRCLGETLHVPDAVRTQAGYGFRVYSAFARAFRAQVGVGRPLAAPRKLPAAPEAVVSDSLPFPPGEKQPGDSAYARGGQRAAWECLQRFVATRLGEYAQDRDRMDRAATSELSPHLKFGTLSPRAVWHECSSALAGVGRDKFLSELLWREFAYHCVWHDSRILESPVNPAYESFPWASGQSAAQNLRKWAEGLTGYPVVDAAARELLATGRVQNRARMISASFLVKHLLLDYRLGESHYFKHLTDGDRAQNNLGWQWSAGAGHDAQPYFRVFNPVTQGVRFDPEGGYVRRWLPELAGLPTRYIHSPWEAPPPVLASAGIRLGETYPEPVVEHKMARERFLELAKEFLRRGG